MHPLINALVVTQLPIQERKYKSADADGQHNKSEHFKHPVLRGGSPPRA